MTTVKQLTANRLNAKKSTGPRSSQGKRRTRQNAFKHGLTAETVVAIFESVDEYTALEQDLIAEQRPSTLVEHLLVVRLASLLWRLKRATAIETGLFEAQGRAIKARRMSKIPNESEAAGDLRPGNSPSIVPGLAGVVSGENDTKGTTASPTPCDGSSPPQWVLQISECFFRLASEQPNVLEQIKRYEMSIWRQIDQTMLVLHTHPT